MKTVGDGSWGMNVTAEAAWRYWLIMRNFT